MKPKIILVLRCVKPDREKEFLESYKHNPTTKGFREEVLTKLDGSESLPIGLRNFISNENNCGILYLNIAIWDSVAEFKGECPEAFVETDEEFDNEFWRRRAVLDVINPSAGLQSLCS